MTNEQLTNAIRTGTFANAKQLIRDKILSDNEWMVRGLLAIFARQTEDEKSAEHTKHHNEVGFNGVDSTILTGFAKQWKARNWFSDKQLAILRRKMPKYAGQLARIVRGDRVTA
jgi:hypothetical protein